MAKKYIIMGFLPTLSCAPGLELFACVCLMLLLLLRAFAIISSSPLFLGRSCVPLILCGLVTRRRSSPLHKVNCCVFFPIQLCIHSLWMSFGSLAWRHCLVRVCIWIAFTQFENHCPSFDALTLESLIANAEDWSIWDVIQSHVLWSYRSFSIVSSSYNVVPRGQTHHHLSRTPRTAISCLLFLLQPCFLACTIHGHRAGASRIRFP